MSLLEASRVFQDMNQPEQTTRLLQRVLKDFPDTEWAKTAQQRLDTNEDERRKAVRIEAETVVGFRSRENISFRGAKGDNGRRKILGTRVKEYKA